MAENVLTLKDMTQGSGCTPRTVRYYEREGLLRALRSAGGHRLFAASELERLNFIISLREAGWSLEEVTEFLALRDRRGNDADAMAAFEHTLRQQIDRLERKIELLKRLHDDLAQTATVLPVCRGCTTTTTVERERVERVDCHTCERVPALDHLPRAFRLIWRARELGSVAPFDEAAADGGE